MPNTKVLIVEDEPIIAADLENQLQKAGLNVLDTLDDGESVMTFLKTSQPDVILMDIQIYGDLDGIDLANHINQQYTIPVIFLTSNTDNKTFNRAKFSFPHSYLSKPFRINDVLRSIELAVNLSDQSEEEENSNLEFLKDRIFIREKDSMVKVLFDDILYVEADGAYTKVITTDKTYVLSQTLKKTESSIITNFIVKVHRSYLANIKNVDRITDGYVYFGKHKIPVSRTYKDDLLQTFKTI